MESPTKVPATLCLIEKEGRVLLGLKKRGFGAGRWNGFGGKVLAGETLEAAAKRELLEECGVVATELQSVGVLDFDSPRKFSMQVHIFRVSEFSGEPVETEEMRPEWFALEDIPFSSMWPDDKFWLPIFLEGKRFRGRFVFGEGDTILEQELTIID